MKQTIDVLTLLTNQHAEVDALFEAIENGRGNKAALFAQLADKLAAHATIEEKIFYPAVFAKTTEDKLRESVEEHLQVKRLIADMLKLDPRSDTFAAKLSVLKEDVSHHAHEEEEQKLFPQLREQLSSETLAGLGNECMAMFEDLIDREPRRNVPNETAHAAPLPSL
ncbi:MAG TPA: hemerythrin domain-containing protein [Kofleriaceae bacterium]|jgi:hemerythrin superfamily protein